MNKVTTPPRQPTRILVIEDSAPIRDLLVAVLQRAGHEVVPAADGKEAVELFFSERPDVVLLDVWLPRLDGWNVLRRIREFDADVPVLMLTGLDDEGSKVRGLTWGADDYLVKPVGAAELLARVQAAVRRSGRRNEERPESPVYDDGVVRVDFQRRQVWIAEAEVTLTPLEFRLLAAFIQHPGEILTREDLLVKVWNDSSGNPGDHVKIYVGYLRRKLAAATTRTLIETVRGYGYRWNAPGRTGTNGAPSAAASN
jgi:DNA-binding response OmpR family regulator